MNMFEQAQCLICHQKIRPDVGWVSLFSIEKEDTICPVCAGGFERITGEVCRICSRPFQRLDEKFRNGELCHDCYRWEKEPEWQGLIEKNISLFHYNDFLKEVIAKFKYRGDYVLAKVFAEMIKSEIHRLKGDLYVPIPLSEERLYERGFNQAVALLNESGLQPTEILTRTHTEKQSKKSRTERIHLPQVFQLKPDLQINAKTIILIDDIYTTGSTLRHAAKLLKNAGAASIKSLTIAR